MLEHMIKENNMMALFEAYGLDVNVIKDLMSGTPGKRAVCLYIIYILMAITHYRKHIKIKNFFMR